jgi:hypothetical protein
MVIGKNRTFASTGTTEAIDHAECGSFANFAGGKHGRIDCAGREQDRD